MLSRTLKADEELFELSAPFTLQLLFKSLRPSILVALLAAALLDEKVLFISGNLRKLSFSTCDLSF